MPCRGPVSSFACATSSICPSIQTPPRNSITRRCRPRARRARMPAPSAAEPATADLGARRPARRYPGRPIVAVRAVVLRAEGSDTRALIVQRAQQPNAGRWGFPGGVLELGETVTAGAMRELLEETGIAAKPAGILDVHDAITRDADGRVQFHYLLIAVRGIWQSGEGDPADDAAACGC